MRRTARAAIHRTNAVRSSRPSARAEFGDKSPIGRYVVMHDGKDTTRLEVIGVARDATYQNLQEARPRTACLAYTQVPVLVADRPLVAVVRLAGRQAATPDAIRAAVRRVDPMVALRTE